MNDKQDVFISGGQIGPVITYKSNPKHVITSWDNPLTVRTNPRKIHPIITEWTELDGDYYDLGKRIYSYLLEGK